MSRLAVWKEPAPFQVKKDILLLRYTHKLIASEVTVQSEEIRAWSLKELIAAAPIVPIVASSFAITYNLGYLLAFDLSWFSFFSLTDHVVFALRAIPVAVGLSVAFLIGFIDPPGGGITYRFAVLSIVALGFVTALLGFLSGHIGLFLVYLFVMGRAFIHRNLSHRTSPFNILYWGVVITLMSLIVGYLSAVGGRYISELDRHHDYFVLASSMGIDVSPSKSSLPSQEQKQQLHYVGEVIFVGSRGVLFHPYGKSARFFQWVNIQNIYQCPQVVTDASGNPCLNGD